MQENLHWTSCKRKVVTTPRFYVSFQRNGRNGDFCRSRHSVRLENWIGKADFQDCAIQGPKHNWLGSKEMFAPSTLTNSSPFVLKTSLKKLLKLWLKSLVKVITFYCLNFLYFCLSDVKRRSQITIMSQFNSVLLVVLVLATTEKGISKGKPKPYFALCCYSCCPLSKMLSI